MSEAAPQPAPSTPAPAPAAPVLTFVPVARVGDIPAGEGRAFAVGKKLIAVFFVDGQYTAIDDACPHMGASLASGYVENGGVTCPWHAWRFSITDGVWMDNPKSRLCQKTYAVQVVNDEIQVAAGEPA